ncbi:30S ribosomal protein S6 [Thermostilla marina]
MAQNFYEGLYILDSGQFARDPNGVVQQFIKVIEDAGGEFLVSRIWEERRLAYPIEGHRKGTYWLTYFKIDGRKLDEVSKQLRHAPGILRFLFVKLDPRIVEVLIAHATGEAIEETPESAGEESSEEFESDAAAVQTEGETA